MRSATSAQQSLFTATERTLVEVYEVTLVSSDVYRFANYDLTLVVGTQTYTALPMQRGPAKFGADLRIDDMPVTIANVGVTFGGSTTPLAILAARGILDGAKVKISLVDANDPRSLYYHSDWTVQGVQADRASVEFKLESPLARLNTMTPRRTWQEQCTWSLFSTWCTLSRAQWTVFGRIIGSGAGLGGGTTTAHLEFTVSSKGSLVPATIPGSWFELGQVVFKSGTLNGLRRTVQVQSLSIPSGSAGAVDVLAVLPVVASSGDQIEIVPGCDKTLTTCNVKFNNAVNYGGFPFIPRPETPYNV